MITWLVIGISWRLYELRDSDTERGAITNGTDKFGNHFSRTVYLDQGWSAADSLWFYTVTQGSNLLPYSFFLVLEQPGSSELFRDDSSMDRYGYLPQRPTASNPDGLPAGMVRDEYQGKAYMGFTCAACHTTQINYQGTGIRIDGGPANSDMETFMVDLATAMQVTLENPEKRDRFVANVLKHGHYNNANDILADLTKYAQRIKTYTIVNSPRDSKRPLTRYGYARLDAFGRIYNRVLEHIMSAQQLRELLADILSEDELTTVMSNVEPVLSSHDRDHIIEKIQDYLTSKQLIRLRNKIYNPADAPVSYPFLWDIPQHDYIQWNGRVDNSGLGPMARNAGQVIGVFATLDWQEKDGFTLSSVLGGQGFGSKHIDFQSSIDIRNLRRVENHLRKLTSPSWPEHILPAIDKVRMARGAEIYSEYCAACHSLIKRNDPERRIVARMISVHSVGTDSKMATNAIGFVGYSGILRNQYVGVSTGNILLQQQAPAVALLTAATRNVVTTPDSDKWIIRRWLERSFDFAYTFFDNEVQSSLKNGYYTPDSTVSPFASAMAYKARPLNGIWATAPYLHNGSIPTLYDLLLPKRRPGDPADGEYRPDEFTVGSREFDPEKVGFKTSGYPGFLFRTHIWGNYNEGHEYASGRTPLPDGSMLPALNKEQRLDLIEFLKSL
ncbi:di-heme-cytochrome C peroxidase [Nitrosomonas sp. sh817]|uniref:di-heme-cytochrome C peroxidase n=1 Tax=Nitrosomonas sp. sh817 TaxID=3070658 RepID=UPI0027DB3351|nr:di-heme-cytochrome C peroxidase [Nitrosomonas sp. sh817]WMJ09010.1 di-heme-cytochrome C peroxidase [Nitrosomonas sp. sh817]